MGVLKRARGDRSVVEPSSWKRIARPVAPAVVLAFQSAFLDRLAQRGEYDRRKARRLGESRYFPPPKKGLPGLSGPAVGSPMAAILLEQLIALGARSIVGFGICGSLVRDLGIGEMLLPDRAFSDEGTSGQYRPGQRAFSTSTRLRNVLSGHLASNSAVVRTGPVWTTDGFYRETEAKIKKFAADGALAVEMETSALCAVAEFRQVEYAALMVVSDELSTLRWRPGFRLPRFAKGMDRALDLLSGFRF